MVDKLPIAIAVSGRGSNMRAILDEIAAGNLAAEVKAVVSDQPLAPALEIAGSMGVETIVLERKKFPDESSFESTLGEVISARGVKLVVLAGFMRLLGPKFIQKFPERVINVHPSLLPAFPGLRAQKQALDYGVKVTGCTVHFVNEIMDGGRIIFQACVPVLDDDDEESLSARILKEEHRLLPQAVAWFAATFKEGNQEAREAIKPTAAGLDNHLSFGRRGFGQGFHK